MSASKDQRTEISSMADRHAVLTVDKNGRRHFSQMAPFKPGMTPDSSTERTSRIYAEATSNTRHWASRDTTSSGTRINNDLSHDACSSRPLSSLFRFLPLRFEAD